MTFLRFHPLLTLALLSGFLLPLPEIASGAEEERPSPAPTSEKSWNVAGEIDGPNDISGLACATAKGENCLLASDEIRSVQCFRMRRGVGSEAPSLVAGRSIELFATGDELDAEGVAHAYGNYYIVGSHSLSRKERLQPNRFHVLRIPDAACGQDDAKQQKAVAGIRRGSLSQAIGNQRDLAPYLHGKLSANGVNIEAVQVVSGAIYIGLRAPCIEGRVPILTMPVSAPFADQESIATKHASLTWLALGEDTGIRDLASVSNGMLVLVGNASPDTDPREPQDSRAAIHYWDLKSESTTLLARLPATASKPEGLLLLAEEESQFKVLVVADSAANGHPTEFSIPKPASP